MQEAATRAVRKGLRTLDRRARGFVPSAGRPSSRTAPSPIRVHLDEWDWPIRGGDVVRGVVLASDRSLAVVQIGEYRARVGPAEIAWTRRANVADALPAGAVAPFLIVSLTDGGRPQGSPGHPRAGAEAGGRPPRHGPAHGRGEGHGGRLRLRESKFNRATQALRQVGSAFKPIVYAAALEKARLHPRHHHRGRAHLLPQRARARCWSPHNYDYTFLGPIPLRHAIEQSRNIPAIKTLQAVGIETGIEYARKLGLTGELPPYLPIAIGAGEATLAGDDRRLRHLRQPGPAHEADVRHPHHRPRGQRHRGGAARRRTDAIRADTAYIMTSLLRGRGGARHGGPRPQAQAAHRGQDGHHQRLHRRLVHRLRALARGRGVGGLRREEGRAWAAGATAAAPPCPSGWSSGRRP